MTWCGLARCSRERSPRRAWRIRPARPGTSTCSTASTPGGGRALGPGRSGEAPPGLQRRRGQPAPRRGEASAECHRSLDHGRVGSRRRNGKIDEVFLRVLAQGQRHATTNRGSGPGGSDRQPETARRQQSVGASVEDLDADLPDNAPPDNVRGREQGLLDAAADRLPDSAALVSAPGYPVQDLRGTPAELHPSTSCRRWRARPAGHVGRATGGSGWVRRMYRSNWGTVKAASP